MRSVQRIVLGVVAVFACLLAGCDSPTSPVATTGWLGPGVHLVDGTWIGTERDCAAGDDGLTCRTTIAEALRLIEPTLRSQVVGARLAELPTSFVTAWGEPRTARISAGVMARVAVVLDLSDGRRRVVGLWCHAMTVLTCDISANALEYWIDGGVPPSYPPGTKFL